jgi:hypothetical protein
VLNTLTINIPGLISSIKKHHSIEIISLKSETLYQDEFSLRRSWCAQREAKEVHNEDTELGEELEQILDRFFNRVCANFADFYVGELEEGKGSWGVVLMYVRVRNYGGAVGILFADGDF